MHTTAWQSEYMAEAGHVRAKASGSLNFEQIKQLSSEVFAAGRQHDTHRCLIDVRDVFMDLTVQTIKQLPDALQELGMSSKHRMALIYEGASRRAGDISLFAVVSSLSGLQVKAFTEETQALQWLNEIG